jgi:hypothetical protein
MKKWSLLGYLKVHKYSFEMEFIIYFMGTFLWYDILVTASPQHIAHQLTEQNKVHIETVRRSAIHKFWWEKLVTFTIFTNR